MIVICILLAVTVAVLVWENATLVDALREAQAQVMASRRRKGGSDLAERRAR